MTETNKPQKKFFLKRGLAQQNSPRENGQGKSRFFFKTHTYVNTQNILMYGIYRVLSVTQSILQLKEKHEMQKYSYKNQ